MQSARMFGWLDGRASGASPPLIESLPAISSPTGVNKTFHMEEESQSRSHEANSSEIHPTDSQPHVKASRCDSQRRTSPERKRHKHGQDQPAEPYLNDKAAHVAAAANGILHKAGSFSAEANGAQQTAGPAHKAKVTPCVHLSFSDELEEEDTVAAKFSLSESTEKRFQKERANKHVTYTIVGSAFSQQAGSYHHEEAAPQAAPSLGQLAFGISVARGARPYMEDRHIVIANYNLGSGGAIADSIPRSFAAVYDGHNGAQTAEEACERLHVLLAAERDIAGCAGASGSAAEEREAETMRTALEGAFAKMDCEILERAKREGGRDGSCALIALRIGDFLWTAHAGDSRAVLSRGGTALRLTEDHKPGLIRERLRVLGCGGAVEFNRCWRVISSQHDDGLGRKTGLAVSRSLGDLEFKQPKMFVESKPDVGKVLLLPEDSLVIMASDGLWDVIEDQQAVDIAHAAIQSKPCSGSKQQANDQLAKNASNALVMEALKMGSLDNITVIVILLQWD